MKKKKILHISSHLGGGVGKALSSIVVYEKENSSQYEHKILLLDQPEKFQFIDICKKNSIEVITRNEGIDINNELKIADIIILHWWHHPVMAEFLCKFPNIPLKVILWCHVNGCNYPNLPLDFVLLPHKTFFTTPFSFENPCWNEYQKQLVREKARVVYGLGKLDIQKVKKQNDTKNFNIGYIGTLNKSKIHPHFVDYCYAVLKKVPDAFFIMVGDNENCNDIVKKLKEYGIQNRFKFVGYSIQVSSELSSFDVFAYPLNPKHFGTTENVLLEAMAAGLPVVALNHNAEKFIIKQNSKVGLLADSMEHYADCIKYLYDNESERVRLGENAIEYIKTNYTLKKNIRLMRSELTKVNKMPKRRMNFSKIFGDKPYQWFLSCLGEEEKIFGDSINKKIICNIKEKETIENNIKNCSPILKEKTKSSVNHFSQTFYNDIYLTYWNNLINGR